jgi:8-oxo-dGTP pyrophosphatase MutT (NUDIX family)
VKHDLPSNRDPIQPSQTGGYPERRPTSDPHRFLIPRDELPQGFAERLGTPSTAVASPRPAATVVLVREERSSLEALLLRRHNRSGFAADAWVFPGGVVDAADMDPALPVLCDGPSPEEWAETLGIPSASEAFGYVTAAVRETLEETGVLLARSQVTVESPHQVPIAPEALDRYREELLVGRTTLREIAVSARIQLAADRLLYLAHWITPEPEPRRYDTRFFLAPLPPGAVYRLHEPELVEARWLSPAEAVTAFQQGEMKMLPPTVHTLRRLADYDSWEEIQAALKGAFVPAILPRMREHPEGVIIEVPKN